VSKSLNHIFQQQKKVPTVITGVVSKVYNINYKRWSWHLQLLPLLFVSDFWETLNVVEVITHTCTQCYDSSSVSLQMIIIPSRFSCCWQNCAKLGVVYIIIMTPLRHYTYIYFVLCLYTIVWCLVGYHARSFIVSIGSPNYDCWRLTGGGENERGNKKTIEKKHGLEQSFVWRPPRKSYIIIVIISI